MNQIYYTKRDKGTLLQKHLKINIYLQYMYFLKESNFSTEKKHYYNKLLTYQLKI